MQIIPPNPSEKVRSFKSKENINKKEVGPLRRFGYSSLISDPLNLTNGGRGKQNVNLQNLTWQSSQRLI